jgi:hypothetical protein
MFSPDQLSREQNRIFIDHSAEIIRAAKLFRENDGASAVNTLSGLNPKSTPESFRNMKNMHLVKNASA